MMAVSESAIILRRRPYGEADLILTVLTAENGKRSAIAKSAKRSVRRFSGALEPFTLVRLVHGVNVGRGRGQLPVLQEASIRDPFGDIRYDPVKTAYAALWTELLDRWLEPEAPQPYLYFALADALAALNAGELPDAVVSLDFLRKFLRASGMSPDFGHCAVCGGPVREMAAACMVMRLPEGRVICPGCGPVNESPTAMPVRRETLLLLWRPPGNLSQDRPAPGENGPLNAAAGAYDAYRSVSNAALTEANDLLHRFLAHHMGGTFKSLAVLDQIQRPMPPCTLKPVRGTECTPDPCHQPNGSSSNGYRKMTHAR